MFDVIHRSMKINISLDIYHHIQWISPTGY